MECLVSFNYDKHKNTGDHGSVWTSYSDLFLGLSIIFLLLYVTVSLRQGTDGFQQHFQNQKLVQENEDLKQQLKVYETLKQDYLEKQASQQDADSYQELMSQLDLLQDKAKEEKAELTKQAAEHEKKERALNKYQQMIRNIINSNLVAKGRIKTRDHMIENKDQQIATNEEEIKSLEQTVGEKRAQLALGEKKIKDLNESLGDRLKQLRNAYKHQKITQKKFEQQKKALEAETQNKIESLRQKNQAVAQQLNAVSEQLNQTNQQLSQTSQALNQTSEQLNQTNKKLGQTSQALSQTSNKLSQAQQDLTKLGTEKNALAGQLEKERGAYQGQIAKLQGDYEAQRGRERAAFEAALKKEKLTGAQRAAREAKFKADADRKARALADQVASLNDKMKATEGELARAQENLNARKKLAQQIRKNFAAAGVAADVDEKTGDVLLSFGNHFFDTDRAVLKPEMLKILQQTFPVYSKSLFQDPKVAKKIQNVEIVGFASPTYQGKYVDPRSLDPNDRKAINYNLDLSYARAKSIFAVVFDSNKMTFEHQKELLPLVKVTGRSFLANPDERGIASDVNKSFCEKNDCAKMQKVIIKFNLKD
jgi:myosin heavy subunit